jgi:hypothetical protein
LQPALIYSKLHCFALIFIALQAAHEEENRLEAQWKGKGFYFGSEKHRMFQNETRRKPYPLIFSKKSTFTLAQALR